MTVTKITDLERSQPTTKDNPVWRVARDISATALTCITNFTPVDGDGNAITKDFIVGITRADGYTEECHVEDLTDNVLTFGARGIKRGGLDYTTGVAANAVTHRAKEEITMIVSSFDLAQYHAALNGDIGSGKKLSKAMSFMDTGNTNNRVFASEAARDVALPTPAAGWKCYVTGVGSQEYSGSAWTTLDTSTPITASNGVQRVSDDFQLNLDTDSKLVIAADKVKVDAVEVSAGAADDGKVVALDTTGNIGVSMLGNVPAPAGVSKKISVSATQVSKNIWTTEQTLFSFTLPANKLSTNNALRIKVPVSSFLASPTNATTIFRLKYGATTIASASFSNTVTTSDLSGFIDAYIIASGSTGSQKGTISVDLSEIGANSGEMYKKTGVSTATEDSTSALTVSFTVIGAWVENANDKVVIEGYTADIID